MTTIRLSTKTYAGTPADAIVLLTARGGQWDGDRPEGRDGTDHPLFAEALLDPSDAEHVRDMVAAVAGSGPMTRPTRVPAGSAARAATCILSPIDFSAPSEGEERIRRAVGAAVGNANGIDHLAICLPEVSPFVLRAVVEGAVLGAYRFNRYRSEPGDRRAPRTVDVLFGRPVTSADRRIAGRAQVVATGTNRARDLVNLPPNDLFPQALEERAREWLRDLPVEVDSWDSVALAEQGFGGLTAVGGGSKRGPRLIRLDYRPENPRRHVALVGKGITFDSGGLSLKTAKGMETMKSDMGGAATVLAVVQAAAALGMDTRVTGWLCAAENMPGGGAQRPGDVIRIRGGRTVEVLNTDAEGRLVLADGLVRAGEDEPDVIIDVATLTGAQMVALGSRCCGVMGRMGSPAAIVAAASRSGESAWPMPLPPELRTELDSKVADLKNIAGRHGGMLSAAIFLREFVPEGTAWAHLDIAGPAFNAGPAYGHTPVGGTGFGVRTLCEYLAPDWPILVRLSAPPA